MKKKTFCLIKILMIIGMYAIGYTLYDQLPEMMPSHWNFEGTVDSFAPKTQIIWLIPTITLGLFLLFHFLPKLDPKKEKYKQFTLAWEIFQIILIAFFAYIYLISIYAALAQIDVGKWIMIGVGVLFVLLGNYMGKIRQNYFVGIKTPWTLNNEGVWNKTHRFGGWCFIISGLIFIVNAFVKIYTLPVFIAAIIIAAILPIVYSYILYKNI